MNIQLTKFDSLKKTFTGVFDTLIVSATFEDRCHLILNYFPEVGRVVVFYNKDHNYNSQSVGKMAAGIRRSLLVPLNSREPVCNFDAIRRVIEGEVATSDRSRIAIDISCFNRETLAIILLVLRHAMPKHGTVTCLYTAAADYLIQSQAEGGETWMSKGVADIRSILGYRGNIQLKAKTHLILLPGFETERAQSIVDYLQPDRLSIGGIIKGESVQPSFEDRLNRMVDRLISCFPSHLVSRVAFSARDPFLTAELIGERIHDDENTVIACLNTKVAMVGVCLAAMDMPSVQLIYAQPLQYNTLHSVSCSGTVFSFQVFGPVPSPAPPSMPRMPGGYNPASSAARRRGNTL
jgi:hypothetical protein